MLPTSARRRRPDDPENRPTPGATGRPARTAPEAGQVRRAGTRPRDGAAAVDRGGSPASRLILQFRRAGAPRPCPSRTREDPPCAAGNSPQPSRPVPPAANRCGSATWARDADSTSRRWTPRSTSTARGGGARSDRGRRASAS
jgi:hypothetical protein